MFPTHVKTPIGGYEQVSSKYKLAYLEATFHIRIFQKKKLSKQTFNLCRCHQIVSCSREWYSLSLAK